MRFSKILLLIVVLLFVACGCSKSEYDWEYPWDWSNNAGDYEELTHMMIVYDNSKHDLKCFGFATYIMIYKTSSFGSIMEHFYLFLPGDNWLDYDKAVLKVTVMDSGYLRVSQKTKLHDDETLWSSNDMGFNQVWALKAARAMIFAFDRNQLGIKTQFVTNDHRYKNY